LCARFHGASALAGMEVLCSKRDLSELLLQK
jgi:hypothetical protein